MDYLLELNRLQKSFAGPNGRMRKVIQVDSFHLEHGKEAGVRGESGCGKTTFLNLIAGILRPDAGDLILDGQNLAHLSEAEMDRVRARRIGYVFQGFNLLQGFTCLENLLMAMSFGKGRDLRKAKELLKRVGLEEKLNFYPRQLSMGEQQRVAIARALANDPQLVLADEPTASLDPANTRQCLDLIRELCRDNQAALLLVSHDRTLLENFGRVLEFHQLNRPLEGASA